MVILTEATNLTEGTRYEVSEVHVHEGYSEMTLDNDIGLLKLAKPPPRRPSRWRTRPHPKPARPP